jgi:hypothetical protein
MNNKFNQFLDKLETKQNKSLIESIRQGYSVIFEGYADVRDIESVDAITKFSRQAAFNSSMEGNNILTFLQNSSEKLSNLYTYDDEEHLDGNPTSSFNQYEAPIQKSFEENLGLTAADLNDLI